MAPPTTEQDAHLKSLLRALLAAERDGDVRNVMHELFRYLSENPRPTIPCAAKVECAIAIDAGNECIEEIVGRMLPDQWRPHVTVATYKGIVDVIRMMQNTRPSQLALITNLLISAPEGIAGCIAVSPNTRYLLITGWSEEHIDHIKRFYEPVHISMETLRMPFDRAQLIAALEPFVNG